MSDDDRWNWRLSSVGLTSCEAHDESWRLRAYLHHAATLPFLLRRNVDAVKKTAADFNESVTNLRWMLPRHLQENACKHTLNLCCTRIEAITFSHKGCLTMSCVCVWKRKSSKRPHKERRDTRILSMCRDRYPPTSGIRCSISRWSIAFVLAFFAKYLERYRSIRGESSISRNL